ncbi:MAG: ABC transporter substrate-binding protein [Anaerolineae bacterium]|nr:ABC transporter substrate-binding protein [Anaerolineae bacterium]NIN97392.1 ABC transporter substrate-binding protein [Anaerolineae bacterium]NIQ80321.1 ABC transporter substrate-binding protein [Anaerolineae bacterium]
MIRKGFVLSVTSIVLASLLLAACAPAPPVEPPAPPEETPAPPPLEETPVPPTPTPPPPLRPIKVGIVDAYTGPAAVYCEEALNGFMLALEEIHAAGDITIEYTTRDTKFEVDTGLAVARELVMMEEVDILVGTISSGVALAVSEYAKEEQIPLIVWISKSENITGAQGHRYVFSTGENTYMAGKAGGVALSQQPYTKYWIGGDDYEYGHAIADAAWRNLQALNPNVELLGESWWTVGEPDLVPYLTAIQAAEPDAVIFATGGASMANIMKAIHSTGMAEKFPIWIHTATDHAVLSRLGEEAPVGVMGTMDYLFYYPETEEHMAFVEAYEAAYGHPPGFPALHGYITGHFIAEALRQAGTVDREAFIDALEGLTVSSPVGPIEMRACDHQAVLPIYMGVTAKSPDYDFLIATDIVTLPGPDVMPTCEEIAAARGE